MIKTISLTANIETEISVALPHAIVTNFGEGVVYASFSPNITANGDNVKRIDAGSADIVRFINSRVGATGKLYLISDTAGDVQVEETAVENFRPKQRGGGRAAGMLSSVEMNAMTEDFKIQDIVIVTEE